MYHYVGNVGIEGMLYYFTTQGKYYTISNGERGVLQYLTGRYQIPVTLEDDGLYYLFVSICCCSGVEVCHHRATKVCPHRQQASLVAATFVLGVIMNN